jgi:hypothetical protein
MSMSDDMRKMADLYCENLGLGPQANTNLNPSPNMPTVIKQDPDKVLNEFLTFLKGLQGPDIRKKVILRVLETIL